MIDSLNSLPDPRDEIRLGLLCPVRDEWKGLCTQSSCSRNAGNCSLSGKPWASFCVIPASHPVRDFQRAAQAAEFEARQHLQ